jgi:hypothetical protein
MTRILLTIHVTDFFPLDRSSVVSPAHPIHFPLGSRGEASG